MPAGFSPAPFSVPPQQPQQPPAERAGSYDIIKKPELLHPNCEAENLYNVNVKKLEW